MVYLYKKTISGKPYYYLRISKRINGKIAVKDIAYLGSDISKIRKELDKLPSEYKKEIRNAYRNINKFIQSNFYLEKIKNLEKNEYFAEELLKQAEAIKSHFNQHFLKLDKETIDDAFKHFLIDFAFNTASIEGNTITLEEASKLLLENLTPKNRTLREVYDLQNTERVFFELIDSKPPINHSTIIKIHDNLMKNIDKRKGYRTHDVKVIRSRFDSSPFMYINTDMDLLLKWFKKNEDKIHPLVLAGVFHHKLEKIHPFSDGNGRTGRIIMNYILLQKKYAPIIIRKSRRGEYLDALSKADNSGLDQAEPKHYKKLISYLAEELIDSYWNCFSI